MVVMMMVLAACGDDNNQTLVRQTVLYGTTLGTDTLGPSNLVLLNPRTGALIRTIGSVGYYVNGIEYDKTTGKLYGTTSTHDPFFPSGLIEINQRTGEGTPIGTGLGLLSALLTADSSGQLYGWWEPSNDDLVSIDKATGVATLVGESGLDTGAHGLAFDANDVLFLVNYNGETYTIDTTTGASTYLGTIGVEAHHGKFHPTSGLYWGIDIADDVNPLRNLVIADLTTFTVVDTVPTIDYLHAIAFATKWVFISM